MSPALIGGLVGLAFAAAEYVMFGALIGRAAERGETGRGPRVLDLIRKVQLVLFPLVGIIAGPYVAGSLGVS
ncbi:hypothetical protein [Propylenella binzhouense]|uniref:Uncharacterized protein n=1 Tax=Propylenella binzhouense TaxID=2555902 RepID=A0A964T3V0_9HYPH|nr:hypothetical protein [Propylenella binzhouense]MYZ47814.1 hypothetical protein [Propylenella binzhouense]